MVDLHILSVAFIIFDIFARYGGDEFIIVFFNTTKQEVEEKLDFMLKKAGNHHLAFDNQAIKLSFSYGLAVFPEDSTLSNILIKKADIRMYINKKEYKEKRGA